MDEHGWSLAIGGAVDKPMNLSLADLRALPSATEYVTLACISNNVGGDLMSTGSFTGVRLRELLALANPRANGTWAAFKARDGYAESLAMSLINGAPEVLVAYDLDGAPLPNAHGFPARIVLPGHYGMKGPKWLDSIQLVDHESGGYWEMQGWDHNAVVKTTARFDVPRDGDIVKLGTVSLNGVAFAGTRGVNKVGRLQGAAFAADLGSLVGGMDSRRRRLLRASGASHRRIRQTAGSQGFAQLPEWGGRLPHDSNQRRQGLAATSEPRPP